MSILRNKLTVYESQNQLLEQEKSDLAETVNMLRVGQIKTEPGRRDPWTFLYLNLVNPQLK